MIAIDRVPPEAQPRLSWVLQSTSLRAATLCLLIYTLSALFLAPTAYAAFLEHYAQAITYFLPMLIFPIAAIGLIVWLRGVPREDVAAHLLGRLPVVLILAIALLAAFAGYTTFKFKIPDIVPFYADHWAAKADAWIHQGDPWRFVHRVWPQAWSNLMTVFYNYLWFFYWFGTPVFVLLWMPHETVKRYLWSMLLTFIVVGTILATSLSSVGPIFYADVFNDNRYAGLTARLEALDLDIILNYADYLLKSYREQDAVFGTGISALPSMHVAVVTLNAWLFTSANRWAGALAWIFAAVILFGSVYTGWHYAIDGYISMMAVTCIWFAVRRAHNRARANVRATGESDALSPVLSPTLNRTG